MPRRPLVSLAVLACPLLALAQPNDEGYTRKIREYTTDPMFLTELVDHLPASARVPSPEKVLGYAVGTPEKLTYAPRVVLRYAKAPELWISGMLDKGEELAEKPAVIDCPVGKGLVVLFSNNPMWRWQTLGSHALVFNALMSWDNLGAGRKAAEPAQAPAGTNEGQ